MSNPLVNNGKKYQSMEDVSGVKPEVKEEVKEVTESTEDTPTVSSIINRVKDKPEAMPKVQVTLYIDEIVARKFTTFGDMYGKGSKSELINDFLTEALKDVTPAPKRRRR